MKNSNKTKKEIRIEINKSVLKKIIKSHKNFASKYEISSVLANFHFELANNHLEIASTDGNRLLISTIEVNNPNNDFCSFNVNGGLLSKLVIFKGSVVDWLEVVILKDSIQFNDNEFGIRQEFKLVEAQFPKYKQLIPDYGNENFAIGLNSQFFKDLSSLDEEYKEDDSKTYEIRLINIGDSENKFKISSIYEDRLYSKRMTERVKFGYLDSFERFLMSAYFNETVFEINNSDIKNYENTVWCRD